MNVITVKHLQECKKLIPSYRNLSSWRSCLYLRRIKGRYPFYSRNRRYHSGNWNQEFNLIQSLMTSLNKHGNAYCNLRVDWFSKYIFCNFTYLNVLNVHLLWIQIYCYKCRVINLILALIQICQMAWEVISSKNW